MFGGVEPCADRRSRTKGPAAAIRRAHQEEAARALPVLDAAGSSGERAALQARGRGPARDRGRRVPFEPGLAVQGLPVPKPVLDGAVRDRSQVLTSTALFAALPSLGTRTLARTVRSNLRIGTVSLRGIRSPARCRSRQTRRVADAAILAIRRSLVSSAPRAARSRLTSPRPLLGERDILCKYDR